RCHGPGAVPAPCEHEPARLVDRDELAPCGVSRDDLAPMAPARLRVELHVDAHPALRLLGIDEEFPDRLRAGVDRERALVRDSLSCGVNASSFPPSALRA